MKKHEVLEALDAIKDMNDKEITANPEWIRKVATAAYGLVKQK